jgi:hypothetical protein
MQKSLNWIFLRAGAWAKTQKSELLRTYIIVFKIRAQERLNTLPGIALYAETLGVKIR